MPRIFPDTSDERTHGEIEVSLRDIGQLFNSIDPSPFHDKDLDADAEEFIISWAREFGPDDPLRLLIHVQHALPADPVEIETAVQNYFVYRAVLARRDFSQLMRQGRTSLAIGLVFLAGCVFVAQLIETATESPVFVVFRESFLIGGWVAMWRPMEIFLYEWWPLRRRWRLFERMSKMPVRVMVKEKVSP